jgi:hypothetical protein
MPDEWKGRPDRPVEVPLLYVRLAEQVQRLKQEPTWHTRGRNAITLTKEPGLRLVLMVLSQGTQISEHQAADPLSLYAKSRNAAMVPFWEGTISIDPKRWYDGPHGRAGTPHRSRPPSPRHPDQRVPTPADGAATAIYVDPNHPQGPPALLQRADQVIE